MRITFLLLNLLIIFNSCDQKENYFQKSWSGINERVWVGSEFWSNRLQDWKIENNRLTCIAADSKLKMRTSHLMNYRIAPVEGEVLMQINLGLLQKEVNSDAAGGFLIGAGPNLDVLGASLVQQKPGKGAGLFIGISASGNLFVKNMESDQILENTSTDFKQGNRLSLVTKTENSATSLVVQWADKKMTVSDLNPNQIEGNIALVSHPGTGDQPGSFWFNQLEIWGAPLVHQTEAMGPIISSQYTLSNDILKLTAQLTPMAKTDPKHVTLEIQDKDRWIEVATTEMVVPGYTATFKVEQWNSAKDIPYRVKYKYRSAESNQTHAFWEGMIKHDPVEKDEITIAGFTGNHNIAHPGLSGTKGTFSFDLNGIWYPHIQMVNNVKAHEPDVLFFSGDQLYEGNSPTFADRNNYELDYLYKWYLYCLAYRHLTKDIPTISIPDDHDVYQGNLWGQNGPKTDVDNKGGYVHPAWFVQMVERTQCSNLPDPFDPSPIEQNIGVYYTSMTYGGIGFAILEDRKFKSGCADNPFITKSRPDHVIDPEFDIKKIDLPGKKLLGERQLEFIDHWVRDWDHQDMKIALSQTIFANMATHHGADLFRLIADLDSNGWPQTGRNKALEALRKGFSFHLAGDQHLASIVHHGIDDWNDAIYSFCVPSIANFYPRAWWPEGIGINKPKGAPNNMGQHKDGFGNLVTVYGVTNPSAFTNISTGHEPLDLHDKMPGYGIVKMNKKDRSIRMECWPRYADPTKENQQYEGWPKTISQFDNYGKKGWARLPLISVKNAEHPPVIELINESTGELVYCVRMKESEFSPKVFGDGSYKITITDTKRKLSKVFKGVVPTKDKHERIIVNF